MNKYSVGIAVDKKDIVNTRQAAIKELIKNNAIEDQQTLVQLIKQRYGVKTNQSIVSRDLRSLGINKYKAGNKTIYELNEIDASKEILRLAIVDVHHNESLIIIKTLPGLAAFVGDYLDMNNKIDILGTIAGENTVFVAPTTIKNIRHTFKKICTLLYVKNKGTL